MKILITAFSPFDGHTINHSKEVLNHLNNDSQLIKKELPVSYIGSFKLLKEYINKYNPDIIILTGEARSYDVVGFEVIAVNEYSKRMDSDNFIPNDLKIINNDIDGLFSTLNRSIFEESFNKHHIKYKISYSAGTYVCNSLMYQTLLYIKENKLNIGCGFIHIPEFSKQNKNEITKGLNEYIKTLLKGQ